MDIAAECAEPTSGPLEFQGEDGESGGYDHDGGTGEKDEREAEEQDAHAEEEHNEAAGLAKAHGIESALQFAKSFHWAPAT